MRFLRLFVLLAIWLSFEQCSNDDQPMPDLGSVQDTTIVDFLDSVGITGFTRDTTGIYSFPITLNPAGQNAAGRVLSIYYVLSIMGGDTIQFKDETIGDPARLLQGASAVYPVGLDLGLELMNEGEEYGFILPPDLAYDSLSFSTLIPSGSFIQFSVRLVDVQTEAAILEEELLVIENYIEEAFLDSLELNPLDSSEFIGSTNQILYKRLEAGIPNQLPRIAESIEINYQGRFIDSTVFDIRYENLPFQYPFDTQTVIPGIDLGVGEMEFGETALLIIPSSFAYRESAAIFPDFDDFKSILVENFVIPDYVERVNPYQTLVFEITLLNAN